MYWTGTNIITRESLKSNKGKLSFYLSRFFLFIYIIFCSELTTVWSALVTHQFSIDSKACVLDIVSSSAHLISLVNQ